MQPIVLRGHKLVNGVNIPNRTPINLSSLLAVLAQAKQAVRIEFAFGNLKAQSGVVVVPPSLAPGFELRVKAGRPAYDVRLDVASIRRIVSLDRGHAIYTA